MNSVTLGNKRLIVNYAIINKLYEQLIKIILFFNLSITFLILVKKSYWTVKMKGRK